MNVNLKLSGLYSSLFVIRISLVFQKKFGGGGKQKRAAITETFLIIDEEKHSISEGKKAQDTNFIDSNGNTFLHIQKTQKSLEQNLLKFQYFQNFRNTGYILW